MIVEPFRWRLTGTYLAHLYKAVAQQHHRELMPVLRRILAPDAVVFDVGGHAGQFAKLFSRLAPQGRVWSFEPGSYARSILRVALSLNGLRNVTVVPMALGAESGIETLTIPLKRPGSLGFGLAHLGQTDARWSRVMAEPIAVVTIDDFVTAQKLDRLDFLKADIEGWEAAMLRGGRTTLARLKPALLIELDEHHLTRAGDTLATTFRLLQDLGYRPLVAEGEILHPVEAPRGGDIWWLPEGRML